MSPALLFPAGLAALAALLLPLLIHIARRTEERRTDFAALRWLHEAPRPRHRPRLDERLLLALRLLLIALLALWLARPVRLDSVDRTPVVAVMPGLDAALAGSMESDDVRPVWLAPGFPGIEQASPAQPAAFASLLRQLDAEVAPGVPLRVLVPEQLQGADAERPRLSRQVEWQVVEGAMAPPPTPRTAAPALTVRHAPQEANGLRYLRAAAIAWTPEGTPPSFAAAGTDEPLPSDARNLIWLAPGPLPQPVLDWIERGGTALAGSHVELPQSGTMAAYWRDDLGTPLVEGAAIGRGRLLRLTRPLIPAEMPQLLEPDFPDHLRSLFAPPAPAPSRVLARDHVPQTGGLSYPQPPRELQPWLSLLIALLLLVERWFATRRSRGIAP